MATSIGLVAGCRSSWSLVPQLLKCWRDGLTEAVSKKMFATREGKTFTFKLRNDVKWHDGQPFTSEDVKFSVEKLVMPFHSRGKVYFGELAAVETPDAQTVIFKLKK